MEKSYTVYEWSKLFLEMGISVFPVHYRSKQPSVKWEKYQTELPTEQDLKRWFYGGSLHSYGVVAGWHDLVILDFDSMDRYHEWNLWTLQIHTEYVGLASELAFRVRTSRGVHIYLSIPGVKQNSHIEGLDIKAHGYVLGPQSTHPNNTIYTARDESIIIPEIPSLEHVLPGEWLEQMTHLDEPSQVITQYGLSPQSSDPFDTASNPLDHDTDLIQQIRQRHTIQSFLQGVTKGKPGWSMASCPFHDDKTPSFWIDEKRQIANCNKCQFPRPFDVINLYARIHRVTDKEAIQILAHS